jgi:branched-chain amino acid transport system permease protein
LVVNVACWLQKPGAQRGHYVKWMAIRHGRGGGGDRIRLAKAQAHLQSALSSAWQGALWAFVPGCLGTCGVFSEHFVSPLFMAIIGLGSILGGFLGATFITILPIALSRHQPAVARSCGVYGGGIPCRTDDFGGLIVWFLIRSRVVLVVGGQTEVASLAFPHWPVAF